MDRLFNCWKPKHTITDVLLNAHFGLKRAVECRKKVKHGKMVYPSLDDEVRHTIRAQVHLLNRAWMLVRKCVEPTVKPEKEVAPKAALFKNLRIQPEIIPAMEKTFIDEILQRITKLSISFLEKSRMTNEEYREAN